MKNVNSKDMKNISSKCMKNAHHWQGLTPDPEKYFGFVYLIECEDGKKYIGKKQYWSAKPKVRGCRAKVYDKQSEKWKSQCWKESDWRTYTGSSKSFNDHLKKVKAKFTIIGQYSTRADLVYAEARQQMIMDVMRDSNYFNAQVAPIKFAIPNAPCEEL